MADVLRSNLAELDLLEIWAYIAEDSARNADRFLDLLDQKCRTLASAPGIGRSREDLAPRLRSLAVQRYVIFYRPIEGGIEVARVLSAYRDVQRAFGRG
ncbi:MAG: type II toxin-antitoxin system RelE/ParE family toxin [Acidobacteriota bacterium]